MVASPSSARLLYRSRCCHYTQGLAAAPGESDEMQIFGVETQITRLKRAESSQVVG
jgi:hypothetical protein